MISQKSAKRAKLGHEDGNATPLKVVVPQPVAQPIAAPIPTPVSSPTSSQTSTTAILPSQPSPTPSQKALSAAKPVDQKSSSSSPLSDARTGPIKNATQAFTGRLGMYIHEHIFCIIITSCIYQVLTFFVSMTAFVLG